MVQFRVLLIFFSTTFALFGASATLIGATVPEILQSFKWDYSIMGNVIACGAIGYSFSTFLCGFLLRYSNPRQIIIVGLFIQGTGLLAFGYSPLIVTNIIASALIGVGQGASEVVPNYCIVRIEQTGRSNLMNLVHSAFTAGAVLAPLAIGQMINFQISWRFAFIGLAIVCFLQAICFAFQEFPHHNDQPPNNRAMHQLRHLLLNRLMLALAAIGGIYVGIEIGISNWIAEYSIKTLFADSEHGAYMVSIYWSGLFIGRITIGFLYRGNNQFPLLISSCCLSSLSLILALLSDSILWSSCFYFAVGFGLSAIYPVVMVIAGQFFGRFSSIAIGIISTGGGIGALIFPLTMAKLAGEWGITIAFVSYLAFAVGMTILAFYARIQSNYDSLNN